jgi:ubiquinol-cytochrome c reductase cytochrome b subunit
MKLFDWLQDRTGYRELVREALDEPVRGGARFAYVWGSALTLTFLTQAVTGALLMTAYQPSATTAWSSVMHISHQMSWGWLIRGLHHYGAQAMVVLLVMHLGQTALYGAYKKPREMNWLLGLGLMGLTLAFSLTGYLLPWDQKGYWATKVATNIAGTVPLVGGAMQRLLVGGADYGHATLTRFYALHVFLLPVGLVALLAAHIALFRRHGVTPPAKANLEKIDRFYPKQLLIDLGAGLAVLAVVYALTLRSHGAHLDAPADPASDYPARPEWYFLALFEALKYVPGNLEWLIAVGIPVVVGSYLVALPFLDDKPAATLRQRLGLLAPLALMLLGAVGLTWSSLRSDAANAEFVAARDLAEQRAARALELARSGVPPAGPLALLASDPQTRGPELFDQHCASCHRLGEHGPEPGKETAPDLTGFGTEKWVLAVLDNPDADNLFGKTPFKGEMPSVVRPAENDEYKDSFVPMKPEDMQTIAAFLVAEASGTGGKGMPGEKMVKERCQSCHRIDGATDSEESNAPELRGWASPPWIAAQIANPGSGKTYPKSALPKEPKGHMPAFEAQLRPDEIRLLSTWVYEAATGRKAP